MKINVEVNKYKALAIKSVLEDSETLESKLADVIDQFYHDMVPDNVKQYIEMLAGKPLDQEQDQKQEEKQEKKQEESNASGTTKRKQKREPKVKEPEPEVVLEEQLVS